jgi:hypothetical protein
MFNGRTVENVGGDTQRAAPQGLDFRRDLIYLLCSPRRWNNVCAGFRQTKGEHPSDARCSSNHDCSAPIQI